jgi:hypothetical protein
MEKPGLSLPGFLAFPHVGMGDGALPTWVVDTGHPPMRSPPLRPRHEIPRHRLVLSRLLAYRSAGVPLVLRAVIPPVSGLVHAYRDVRVADSRHPCPGAQLTVRR